MQMTYAQAGNPVGHAVQTAKDIPTMTAKRTKYHQSGESLYFFMRRI